jgi:putative membrane protein
VADPRDYLAEERTFLAWIRTGLAVMASGLVVARVVSLSTWLGMALITVGVAVTLLSAWRHTRVVAAMNDGRFADPGPSREAITLALFLASGGIAMAIYLAVN